MQPTPIIKARWPEAPPADAGVLASAAYVDDLVHNVRLQKQVRVRPARPGPARPRPAEHGGPHLVRQGARPQAILNPKKPKKGEVPQKPTRLTIIVAAAYPAWQQSVVRIMGQHYAPATRTFADERTLLEAFKGDEAIKRQMKRVMTFVATIKVCSGAAGRGVRAVADPVAQRCRGRGAAPAGRSAPRRRAQRA